MRISVLVLDGVFDLGLAAILDTLGVASALAAAEDLSDRFTVRRVGLRRNVTTAQGLKVPVELLSPRARPDIVIVPALGTMMPDTLGPRLAARDVADAGVHLRRLAAAGSRLCAACTGSFVLAEASVLDGEAATTSWWLSPMFRDRYRRVDLDESRMVVESNGRVTAGAALSHIDLALWLVRRVSPVLAGMTARYLVLDQRSSQSRYAIPDHLVHADPMVERFERWARSQLARPFSLEDASRAVGTSGRTLARRLRLVLGKSPLSYVQDLRVERAVHRLATSDASIDDIAAECGYEHGLTLRTLLRRKTGQGIRALRNGAITPPS
jgi:transcriptional regulator GlxA family with amidase domain